jgi:uncharacterized protein YrrD
MGMRDVSPIHLLTGMTVLSLTTGNKLGQILDLFIDPINGVLSGVTMLTPDQRIVALGREAIHSLGRDALMVTSDESVAPLDSGVLGTAQQASKLIGTRIITESGDLLGRITKIFVTLKHPPYILYEARRSFLDTLLRRGFFIPASVGHALSSDAALLVVPDETRDTATTDLASLLGQGIQVRSYDPSAEPIRSIDREDDTIIVGVDDGDETIVRFRDDDETIVRQPLRVRSATARAGETTILRDELSRSIGKDKK